MQLVGTTISKFSYSSFNVVVNNLSFLYNWLARFNFRSKFYLLDVISHLNQISRKYRFRLQKGVKIENGYDFRIEHGRIVYKHICQFSDWMKIRKSNLTSFIQIMFHFWRTFRRLLPGMVIEYVDFGQKNSYGS